MLSLQFIILMIVVILCQVGAAFLLTKDADDVASSLANTLDNSWEDELKNPGAMSQYENWVHF